MKSDSKENEYMEIFLAEALEISSELNRLLVLLEKNSSDTNSIQSLFRVTHTLKGNAAGMGYKEIAEMAHTLEDLFGEVRDGKISLGSEIFASVFKAADTLADLIQAIKEPKDVKYKGIKTKIDVFIKNAKKDKEDRVDATESKSDKELDDSDKEVEDMVVSEAADANHTNVAFSDLVQVPVKKLDNLLNLVGELVIERDRLIASQSSLNNVRNGYSRLNRISADLQYSVMDVRLVQVGFLLNKFHRIVRDVSSKEGKAVDLQLEGTDTEIDRSVLHVISDSLIHLVRNSVGHGIEPAEVRKKAGKPEEGRVTISASSESDTVIITVKDDGCGIDPQKVKAKAIEKRLIGRDEAELMKDEELTMLIFEPGFSTVDQVTSISGRGVGMDVVKRALDSIGGAVQVESEQGRGTSFILTLPSTMAVKSTLLCEISKQTYAIPLAYTESVVSISKSDIHQTPQGLIATHLNSTISIILLSEAFDKAAKVFDSLQLGHKMDLVVINFNGRKIGLVVDKLLQQKEIIEKPLSKPFDFLSFLSGVTILGNGSVCLVLNIPILISFLANTQQTKHGRS